MYCGGAMRRGSAPFHLDRDDVHIILDDVPAWICSQCGQPLFDEKQVAEIQKLVEFVDQRAEKLHRTA
jgi:YgiT-type zinc finger domain-containing protein